MPTPTLLHIATVQSQSNASVAPYNITLQRTPVLHGTNLSGFTDEIRCSCPAWTRRVRVMCSVCGNPIQAGSTCQCNGKATPARHCKHIDLTKVTAALVAEMATAPHVNRPHTWMTRVGTGFHWQIQAGVWLLELWHKAQGTPTHLHKLCRAVYTRHGEDKRHEETRQEAAQRSPQGTLQHMEQAVNAEVASLLVLFLDEQAQLRRRISTFSRMTWLRSKHVSDATFKADLQRVFNPPKKYISPYFYYQQGLDFGHGGPWWYVYAYAGPGVWRLIAASRDKQRVIRVLKRVKRSKRPWHKLAALVHHQFYKKAKTC